MFAFLLRSFRRDCQIRIPSTCPEEQFAEKKFFLRENLHVFCLSLLDIEQKFFRFL